MTNSMKFSQNPKYKVAILSSDATVGFTPKRQAHINIRDICTTMLAAILFTMTKVWTKPSCPLSHRSKKIANKKC